MCSQRVCQSGRAGARSGFTLMELLVVIGILLVLIGVSAPLVMGYLESSKLKAARVSATNLAEELRRFNVANSEYPPENSWDQLPLPPERQPPIDPWGHVFQWNLRQIGQGDSALLDPIVWSGGPDGKEGPEGRCSSASR